MLLLCSGATSHNNQHAERLSSVSQAPVPAATPSVRAPTQQAHVRGKHGERLRAINQSCCCFWQWQRALLLRWRMLAAKEARSLAAGGAPFGQHARSCCAKSHVSYESKTELAHLSDA